MHFQLDRNCFGTERARCGNFNNKRSKLILGKDQQTYMPRVIAWNLIIKAFEAFDTKCGTSVFDSFWCLKVSVHSYFPGSVFIITQVDVSPLELELDIKSKRMSQTRVLTNIQKKQKYFWWSRWVFRLSISGWSAATNLCIWKFHHHYLRENW